MKRIFSYILYLTLFIPPLIFFTDLTRNPYYFQIVLVNSLTLLLWITWLVKGIKDREVTLYRTPLDLQLGAFLLIATVSWLVILLENFNTPYLKYSVYSEGSKRWFYLLVNSVLVYYIPVYFLNKETRNKFVNIIILASFIASVYGVLQYFGIEFIWSKVLNPFGGRSVSTFGNPNFLSSYLVLLFPVIFVFYIQSKSSLARLYYFIVFSSNFAALLCTMTRSSWLGAFIAMIMTLFFIWVYEKELFKKIQSMVTVMSFILLFAIIFWPKSTVSGYKPSVIERLTEAKQMKTNYYGPFHQRRLIWSCAWIMIVEKPVIGKGWGCFELFYPFYQGRHLFLRAYHGLRTHANNCHNEILEIWSQTGTLGFGIYLWLIFSVFSFGYFMIKNTQKEERLLSIALLSSLAGMLFDNLLNVSLHFAIPGFLYWWNVGLLASLEQNRGREVDLKPLFKQIMLYFIIIFFVFFILRYVGNFLGEVHYFAGFKLSKQNEIMASIPELEKAHNYQRFEVNNNYELANSYARSNQRDKAIYMYKESLRANAGYDEIYFNMATVLVQMGKVNEALPEYTRALYINPVSMEAYSALGSIFLQDPDRYNASGIALFKQCSTLFPDNKDVWNNMGYLYTKTNKFDEALEAYKKAIALDPDFDLAKRNARIVLLRTNKKDPFIDDIENSFNNIEINVKSNNWGKALKICQHLVEIAPNSFKARLYLANIYFTLKDFDKAAKEYNESLRLRPSNPLAMTNLGLLYFETKKYDLAKRTFEDILRIDPKNDTAKQILPRINSILYTPVQNRQ
ncbi:MAG: tetratricopeptide repeat protein [Elusimicrobia bacterium]|nr:tetratricopeptide repeat protein [Candidatus Liberimonas magnetica]